MSGARTTRPPTRARCCSGSVRRWAAGASGRRQTTKKSKLAGAGTRAGLPVTLSRRPSQYAASRAAAGNSRHSADVRARGLWVRHDSTKISTVRRRGSVLPESRLLIVRLLSNVPLRSAESTKSC
ncbi:hypothetical protein [Amycolatopsis kentuckyensis]|uniref:hypothetical protein n=1 Tax=Amycolatopsis kentuckyensis TaxID=218823 RepID=UPI0035621883